jgi:hypothetical protein
MGFRARSRWASLIEGATMRRALLVSVGVAIGGSTLVAAPASATHTHVMEVRDGQCVVLAEDAGEEQVVLPDAVFQRNPNVVLDAGAATRSHPLHVLVHKREGGTRHPLYVLGEDTACTTYVNR